VLECLHEERFQDCSPVQVYAALLHSSRKAPPSAGNTAATTVRVYGCPHMAWRGWENHQPDNLRVIDGAW